MGKRNLSLCWRMLSTVKKKKKTIYIFLFNIFSFSIFFLNLAVRQHSCRLKLQLHLVKRSANSWHEKWVWRANAQRPRPAERRKIWIRVFLLSLIFYDWWRFCLGLSYAQILLTFYSDPLRLREGATFQLLRCVAHRKQSYTCKFTLHFLFLF